MSGGWDGIGDKGGAACGFLAGYGNDEDKSRGTEDATCGAVYGDGFTPRRISDRLGGRNNE